MSDFDWSWAGASTRSHRLASASAHLCSIPHLDSLARADQDTDRCVHPPASCFAVPPTDWTTSCSYVFEVLAPHLRTSLRASKKSLQWTDNWSAESPLPLETDNSLTSLFRSAEHLRRLHAEGFREKDVVGAMQQLPVVSRSPFSRGMIRPDGH